jgi:hypothetical protein
MKKYRLPRKLKKALRNKHPRVMMDMSHPSISVEDWIKYFNKTGMVLINI